MALHEAAPASRLQTGEARRRSARRVASAARLTPTCVSARAAPPRLPMHRAEGREHHHRAADEPGLGDEGAGARWRLNGLGGWSSRTLPQVVADVVLRAFYDGSPVFRKIGKFFEQLVLEFGKAVIQLSDGYVFIA